MKLVFFGPPGAGKGTQASLVSEALGIPHISTGDMFRANIGAGTPLGLEAKSYIEKGHLVPDEVTLGMVRERLAQDDCAQGMILDGFPRTLEQAKALSGIVAIDAVISLEASDDFIARRIVGRRVCRSCGCTTHVELVQDEHVCPECGGELIQRADDKPETVLSRLKVYHEQTSPLEEYYREQGLLHSVDATIPKAGLTKVILAELEKI